MAHANSRQDEPITAINITPLVDVSLVLVIVFMITMPYMMERTLKIKASDERVGAVSPVNTPILLEIEEKSLILEGRHIDVEGLLPAIKELMAKRGVHNVAVRSQPIVPHGHVVAVLDRVAATGAELSVVDPE